MKLRSSLFVSSVLGFLALTLAACNGGGLSSGGCANTPSCGGNLVGTWKVTSTCVTETGPAGLDDCPAATVTVSNVQFAGTETYNADLTYSSTGTVSEDAVISIPASCLMTQGITLTCDQVTQSLASQQVGDTITCKAAGAGCSCSVGVKSIASDDSGTYTVAGGVHTDTAQNPDDSDVDDFCVKGTTLTESPHSMTGMMGEMLSGTITLTKQ
jgi:hypothetical protein